LPDEGCTPAARLARAAGRRRQRPLAH